MHRICVRYNGETFYSEPIDDFNQNDTLKALDAAAKGQLKSLSFKNRFGGRSYFPKGVLLNAVMWVKDA